MDISTPSDSTTTKMMNSSSIDEELDYDASVEVVKDDDNNNNDDTNEFKLATNKQSTISSSSSTRSLLKKKGGQQQQQQSSFRRQRRPGVGTKGVSFLNVTDKMKSFTNRSKRRLAVGVNMAGTIESLGGGGGGGIQEEEQQQQEEDDDENEEPSSFLSPPPSSKPRIGGFLIEPPKLFEPSTDFEEGEGSTDEFQFDKNDSNNDGAVPTKLHQILAGYDTTIGQIRRALDKNPSAASIADKHGKLPLHILSENDDLHAKLGPVLDGFILDELIQKNRKALITRSKEGDFPFVRAIREWLENINEVTKDTVQRILLRQGSSSNRNLSYLESSSIDFSVDEFDDNSQRQQQQMDDDELRLLSEKLIPWNVFIDDLALWSINMLSIMIEREPLKTVWVMKIVEECASLPNFIKTILLIDDNETQQQILQTRLLNEILLHEKSVGPWLTYMITSEDDIAQERAVTYMQMMTKVEQKVSGGVSSVMKQFSSRMSAAFTNPSHQINERKEKVFNKASTLPQFIPSLMQLDSNLFKKASTTSIVQYALDQKLFQHQSLMVILADIFFLVLAVVLFTIDSREVFELVSQIKYSQEVVFYPNMTAYTQCESAAFAAAAAGGGGGIFDNGIGTTLDDYGLCNYYNYVDKTFLEGSVDCGINCRICHEYLDFESSGSIVRSTPTDGTFFVMDDTTLVDENSTTTPSSDFGDTMVTCYDAGSIETIDTLLIYSLLVMSLNCLYFLARSLSAWITIPRQYLRSQFGSVFTFLDTISTVLPVVIIPIFLSLIYRIDDIEEGEYISSNFYNDFLQNTEILAGCSAIVAGLLYFKVVMYFKVLNQYTATFIFALGEVINRILLLSLLNQFFGAKVSNNLLVFLFQSLSGCQGYLLLLLDNVDYHLCI